MSNWRPRCRCFDLRYRISGGHLAAFCSLLSTAPMPVMASIDNAGPVNLKLLSTDRLVERCDLVETRLTLRPGMPGTKRLLDQYGDRLICVRYLYDEATSTCLKTVELVVEKAPWVGKPRKPRRQDHDMVAVRIAWDEWELRAAVKQAGAIWRPRQRVWELDWKSVRALKIQERLISTEPEKTGAE